jgi:hypothetical protein
MKPLYASLIALLAGTVAAVLAMWLMVMPLFWAIVIAAPIAACVLLATLVAGVASPVWQMLPAPEETLTVHQASTLSSRFAEAAKDQSRFVSRVQPRLRGLALKTLKQRIPDLTSLNDERARRELGADLHTLLTDRGARMPSPHRLTELLSRLEGK